MRWFFERCEAIWVVAMHLAHVICSRQIRANILLAEETSGPPLKFPTPACKSESDWNGDELEYTEPLTVADHYTGGCSCDHVPRSPSLSAHSTFTTTVLFEHPIVQTLIGQYPKEQIRTQRVHGYAWALD